MSAYRKRIPLDKWGSIFVDDDFLKQVEKSSRTDHVCPKCGTMVRALVHKPCQRMDVCGPVVRVWCPKCGERTDFTMFGEDREEALNIWVDIMKRVKENDQIQKEAD